MPVSIWSKADFKGSCLPSRQHSPCFTLFVQAWCFVTQQLVILRHDLAGYSMTKNHYFTVIQDLWSASWEGPNHAPGPVLHKSAEKQSQWRWFLAYLQAWMWTSGIPTEAGNATFGSKWFRMVPGWKLHVSRLPHDATVEVLQKQDGQAVFQKFEWPRHQELPALATSANNPHVFIHCPRWSYQEPWNLPARKSRILSVTAQFSSQTIRELRGNVPILWVMVLISWHLRIATALAMLEPLNQEAAKIKPLASTYIYWLACLSQTIRRQEDLKRWYIITSKNAFKKQKQNSLGTESRKYQRNSSAKPEHQQNKIHRNSSGISHWDFLSYYSQLYYTNLDIARPTSAPPTWQSLSQLHESATQLRSLLDPLWPPCYFDFKQYANMRVKDSRRRRKRRTATSKSRHRSRKCQ